MFIEAASGFAVGCDLTGRSVMSIYRFQADPPEAALKYSTIA